MAHGLVEGLDKGAYREPVWHQGDTDSTITGRSMTADEARKIAFPWEPILVPTWCAVGDGKFLQVPGTFQVVRNDLSTDDPRRFISTGRGVGRNFSAIDNTQVAEMMDALIQHGAHVVSAFSLYGGQRVVMVGQVGKDTEVKGDAHRLHLVMTTAHDGTAALKLLTTPTRVICSNTLSFAFRDCKSSATIQHRKNAIDRIAEAGDIIKFCSDSFGSQIDILRSLSKVKMTKDRAEALLNQIIDGDSKQAEKTRDKITALFYGGQIGFGKSVKDNAFGMVSAVSEWIETGMTLRAHKNALGETRDETELRTTSVLFGAGARLRQRAVDKAMVLLN